MEQKKNDTKNLAKHNQLPDEHSSQTLNKFLSDTRAKSNYTYILIDRIEYYRRASDELKFTVCYKIYYKSQCIDLFQTKDKKTDANIFETTSRENNFTWEQLEIKLPNEMQEPKNSDDFNVLTKTFLLRCKELNDTEYKRVIEHKNNWANRDDNSSGKKNLNYLNEIKGKFDEWYFDNNMIYGEDSKSREVLLVGENDLQTEKTNKIIYRSFKRNELQALLEPIATANNLIVGESVESKKVQHITRKLRESGWDAKEGSVAEAFRKLGYVKGRRK